MQYMIIHYPFHSLLSLHPLLCHTPSFVPQLPPSLNPLLTPPPPSHPLLPPSTPSFLTHPPPSLNPLLPHTPSSFTHPPPSHPPPLHTLPHTLSSLTHPPPCTLLQHIQTLNSLTNPSQPITSGCQSRLKTLRSAVLCPTQSKSRSTGTTDTIQVGTEHHYM